MEFVSDVVFTGADARLLIKVRDYFQEVKDYGVELTDAGPINYKVFMFCTYLGFTVSQDDFEFGKMEEILNDKSFSIPRTVLYQYSMRMKELLICAKFFLEDFNVGDEHLQEAWNQKIFNENTELFNLIKEKAVIGARYFVSLIDAKLDRSINSISKEIDQQLEELLLRIDDKRTENNILLEDIEIESKSEKGSWGL